MTKQQVLEIVLLRNALTELASASKDYILLKPGRTSGKKRLEDAIVSAEGLYAKTGSVCDMPVAS